MKLQANKTRRLFEDKTGLVLWSIIVILFVVLAISSDVFLSTRNFQSMALQIAPLGLLSLGMMFALVSGGINLGLVATGNLSCISRMACHPAAPGRSNICRHFRFRIIKTTSR